MTDQKSNGTRKYKDLVAFVDVGAREKKLLPRAIGQMWKDDKGVLRFRLDMMPVAGWDGSGVIEDHDERVRRAEEQRAKKSGGRGDSANDW